MPVNGHPALWEGAVEKGVVWAFCLPASWLWSGAWKSAAMPLPPASRCALAECQVAIFLLGHEASSSAKFPRIFFLFPVLIELLWLLKHRSQLHVRVLCLEKRACAAECQHQ